jgi:sugar/nucleoside kinase (ribokinase family)
VVSAGGPEAAPEYLVVGHVTRDVTPGAPGGFVYGGTALFAALTASHLGHRAAILTRCAPEPGLSALVQGLDLQRVPAEVTTTFENVYGPSGRVQYVRAAAPPIPAQAIPPRWLRAPLVHLGPVAQEVPPELVEAFPETAMVGATMQGWLRAWPGDGRVRNVPWPEAERVLSRVDALIFSPEDVEQDAALIRYYAGLARLAVVTEARNGCTVWHEGRQVRYPPFEAREVDPTGAGDVFAAAFFLRYTASRDVDAAARYANCAASFAVEGRGTAALPDAAAVEHRLRTGRLLG